MCSLWDPHVSKLLLTPCAPSGSKRHPAYICKSRVPGHPNGNTRRVRFAPEISAGTRRTRTPDWVHLGHNSLLTNRNLRSSQQPLPVACVLLALGGHCPVSIINIFSMKCSLKEIRICIGIINQQYTVVLVHHISHLPMSKQRQRKTKHETHQQLQTHY